MEIAVIGAGAIGAACARELSRRGHRVVVYDAGVGRQAGAFAAAGILHPSHPQTYPPAFHALRQRAEALWRVWQLRYPALQVDTLGVIAIGDDPAWRAWRERNGMPNARTVHAGAVHWLFPEVMAVRTPRLAPVLLEGIEVVGEEVIDPRSLLAEYERVVVAAGAWAQALLDRVAPVERVAPRKGQLVLFGTGQIEHIIWQLDGEGLAVPRRDGQVVVGVTLEDVGFDASCDGAVADELTAFAERWVPRLGPRVDHWAGMRPWSARAVPTIGPVGDGLIHLAVGHHRNGILLAPATAELVADGIDGAPPQIDPTPYLPRRG